ncbi:unnamed protein product [Cylicocyclus nassatus]|uniref:Uncharacterized protein n=1 Tax=Cylicocyclus nassatus TaxID=53992 RepID=A0AA36MAM1_CYLNA|nr:unnamed protein product [Cylicocyclus nassatus]
MSRAMFGVFPVGDTIQIRDQPTMVTRLCEAMWHSEARALQYAVPTNCLFIGALSFLLPAGPLSAAMMLDAFLLAMAAPLKFYCYSSCCS